MSPLSPSCKNTCWYAKNNMASRQEAKLRYAHIFAARAFQAILTALGIVTLYMQ